MSCNIFVTLGSIELRIVCCGHQGADNRRFQQHDVANTQINGISIPILRGAVRLPDSLLHIFPFHQAWSVLRGRHHEPEGHPGRVVAQDDVLNPGEFPPDSKHNVRLVKGSETMTQGCCSDRIAFCLLLPGKPHCPCHFWNSKGRKRFSLKFLVDEMVPHGISKRRPEQEHLAVVPFVLRKHGAFLPCSRLTSAVITKTFTTL